MKINQLIGITVIGATLFACGGENLDAKKEALKGLRKDAVAVNKKIKALVHEIDSLEGGVKKISYTPVNVSTIAQSSFSHQLEVQGVVDASKDIVLYPEAPGRVRAIKVKKGQRVTKGQTLVVLDSEDAKKERDALKTNLDFATTMFEKQKALWDQKIGSEVSFLQAKSQKESLESQLESVNEKLQKFIVTAPISGYLEDIDIKIGEMANPANPKPLARIVNTDDIQVKAEVSEMLLGKVSVGDKVTVKFPSIDFTSVGKVVQSGQYIDPMNRTFKVLINLDKKHNLLKPNLLSTVYVTDYQNNKAISVPSVTVLEDLKGQYVYLLSKDNTAAKTYVEVGKLSGDNLEITKGLKVGDVLITVGQRNIATGEKVSVVK